MSRSWLTFEHDLEWKRVVHGPIGVAICSGWSAVKGAATLCRSSIDRASITLRATVGEVSPLASSLVVGYVEAISSPTHRVLCSLFRRVDERLHPVVVIAVGFHEVDDVEAVHFVFARVLDPKEVPLGVAVRSVVIF